MFYYFYSGGARAIKTIPVTIPADQTYQIDLLDYHTKVATSVARFGDPVTLRVLMGGTDDGKVRKSRKL